MTKRRRVLTRPLRLTPGVLRDPTIPRVLIGPLPVAVMLALKGSALGWLIGGVVLVALAWVQWSGLFVHEKFLEVRSLWRKSRQIPYEDVHRVEAADGEFRLYLANRDYLRLYGVDRTAWHALLRRRGGNPFA